MPIALMLAACSQPAPPPRPEPAPRETAVLLLSIMSPNESPVVYQQEFATIAACEAARQTIHREMDAMIERAKAVDFNQSSPMGWTDSRSRYHAIHSSMSHAAYPDTTATCAAHAIAAAPQGAPIPPLPPTMAPIAP